MAIQFRGGMGELAEGSRLWLDIQRCQILGRTRQAPEI